MEREPMWHWRNCRDIGFSMQFWPFSWGLSIGSSADVYGGEWVLNLGPFSFMLHANIGNASSENPIKAWVGLSETEAYERAMWFEGIEADSQ